MRGPALHLQSWPQGALTEVQMPMWSGTHMLSATGPTGERTQLLTSYVTHLTGMTVWNHCLCLTEGWQILSKAIKRIKA